MGEESSIFLGRGSYADMGAINFFNSIEHLEPKCSKCGTVLDYGVNTRFDDEKCKHVCLNCGSLV